MASNTTVTISPMERPRNAKGVFTGGSIHSPAEIAAERLRHAKAWRQFRARFLYSQRDLAHSLSCSVRTVSKVEGAECIPLVRFQRAFRNLVREERERVA